MYILAQITSFIALILYISSVQMKEKKNLIFIQIFSNLFYGITYLFLNTPTAFFVNIISVCRNILLYFSKKTPSKIFLVMFILLILTLGIISYAGPLSLIPIAISLTYTISTWQNSIKSIRILFVIVGLAWGVYNYQVGAYVAILGNACEVISGAISLFRHKNN